MQEFEPPPFEEDAVGMLVAQMMQTTGCLSLIVNHLLSWTASEPEAGGGGGFDEILAEMLCDVLEELRQRHPVAEIAAAAALLDEAQKIICDEIHLVEREPPPCQRRAPRKRARR
jgi:hypothetical protein